MNDTQDLIRKNIKRIRRLYGYTQETIATKVLHISLSSYQKLEQGQRKFTLEHLIQISNFLGIELPALLRMPCDESNILNQSAQKRKEFLIELLKTFSIGTAPQEKYTLKDISALLTFIKTYGHTIIYSPKRLRSNIIHDGKIHYRITERIEEIEDIYAQQGIPKKYKEVNDLINQECILQNKINQLQEILDDLSQQKKNELTPTIQELDSIISTKKMDITEMDLSIRQKKEESIKIDAEVREKKGVLDTLNYDIMQTTINIEELKSNLSAISSMDEFSLSDYTKGIIAEISSLSTENALLKKKIDDYEDEIDHIYDEYDDNVYDAAEEQYKERLDADIDNYIFEYYYGLSGEEIEDIIFLLLKYVQAFLVVSHKYKTASKDASTYIKRFMELTEGFDYKSAISEQLVLEYVKEHIEWENRYAHSTDNTTRD